MPDQVLTDPAQATPEWLTRVLIRGGALTHGNVADVQTDADERTLSTSVRLRVRYTDESKGDMPRRLFLKTVNADMEDEFFGSSEVDYYVRDYVGVECAPIIRCYDAAFSAEQRRYHLLLDDLTESHIEARHKTPALEYGLALAEGLACLHAHWWGAERIALSGDRMPTAQQINRFVEIARPGAGHIVEAMPDKLQPHWPEAIDELIEHHPGAMVERTQDSNGFALIHGDVNRTNILVPHDGDRPLYIIDRQPFDWSLTVWLAVYDLAYAMVLDWDIERRRRYEIPILRHYHDQLSARGVAGYSWERLFDDYRLSVGICVYVAIEWCRDGINHEWAHIWLPKLQNSLTACDDLNSRELWT
jgi:hypothetical protein